MASPRLETYCCPNRDAATQLVMNFQPQVFCGVCIGSASASLLLTILQLLPKKGQSLRKMPKASSSSTILLLISVCDILGGSGKRHLGVPRLCCSRPCRQMVANMLRVFRGRSGLSKMRKGQALRGERSCLIARF